MQTIQIPFERAWHSSRPLTLLGLISLLVLFCSLIGMLVDPRLITNMPAWDKPAKFGLSIAIYSFTLIWILSFITGRWARLARFTTYVTLVGFLVEIVIIVLQAARGTTSHFNVATPLDAALFNTMGAFIGLVWVANLVAAITLLLQKLPDRAFALSLRLAILLSLVGGALGAAMVAPTPAQRLQAHPTLNGAHTVGGPDGGPGLPFLGWSTLHGDLRVPHFIGLHALQVLPLLLWLISRRRSWTQTQRLGLVWTAAGGYLGLVMLLFWQAERGQSLVAPDRQTLIAAALLVALTVISTLLVLRHRPTQMPTLPA